VRKVGGVADSLAWPTRLPPTLPALWKAYTMPDDRHVHWSDAVSARNRLTEEISNRVPSGERPTLDAYRRLHFRPAQENHERAHESADRRSQDRLTQENLDRVPIGGALADGAYRKPQDRLTQGNLHRIPIGGFLADSLYRRPQDRLTQENLDCIPVGGVLADRAYRRPQDRSTSEHVNEVSVASFHASTREWPASLNRPDRRQISRNQEKGWFMR
jgi:hypothetical protein